MFDIFKASLRGMKSLTLLFYHSSTTQNREKPSLFKMLLTGKVKNDRGAKFMSEKGQKDFFARSNKGLLVDGKAKRLSLDESFKHLLLVAQTGAGKTTKFIIPNVLKLAETQNSILITDPSGEIFKQTSGYMQSRGFNVLKFDPKDPDRSIYFNPLRFVFDHSSGSKEVDQIKVSLLAMSLVSSSLPGERDFWHIGAEGIIEFLTLCLLNTPKEYHNLYNLYKILEAVTPTGELLTDFMSEYGESLN